MNGVKNWIVFITFAVAVVVFVLAISNRFDAGAHRRHDICVEINNLKRILHDEHLPKLKKAQQNLMRYPHGLEIKTSAGTVRVTHLDLLRARNDEAKIVRDTKQKECP